MARRGRCTLALTLAGQEFELIAKMTGPDEAELRQHNPLGRLPFLRIAGDRTLIDSMAILRWLDQQTSQFRPANLQQDVRCEEIMAIANGVCEKAMASFYERTRRPAEYLYPDWVARCSWQVRDGLTYLDAAFAGVDSGADPYFFGDQVTYADLFTFVAAQFVAKTNPELNEPGTYAHLDSLETRLSALHPIFVETKP